MEEKDLFKDDLRYTDWLGEVVDVNDPNEEGRVRVRVFGKFDLLPVESIPWAICGNKNTASSSTGSGFHSPPKLGSIVAVDFNNGDLYEPIYTYSINSSVELKEELTGDNYINAHSLIYDVEIEGGLKIFYTQEKGLMNSLDDSQINIRTDNTIYLEHKEGLKIHLLKDHISLGQETESAEPAVLGDTNYDVMMEFIADLGKVAAITTPTGPTGPISGSPLWAAFVQKWKQRWKDTLSAKVSLD